MSKFKKNSPEWRFFADFYLFAEKYYNHEDTLDFWNSFIKEGNELIKKYSQEDKQVGIMAKRLLYGFSDYLDEVKRDGV